MFESLLYYPELLTTNQKAGSSNLSGHAISCKRNVIEIPLPLGSRLAHARKTAQVRISQGAPSLVFETSLIERGVKSDEAASSDQSRPQEKRKHSRQFRLPGDTGIESFRIPIDSRTKNHRMNSH